MTSTNLRALRGCPASAEQNLGWLLPKSQCSRKICTVQGNKKNKQIFKPHPPHPSGPNFQAWEQQWHKMSEFHQKGRKFTNTYPYKMKRSFCIFRKILKAYPFNKIYLPKYRASWSYYFSLRPKWLPLYLSNYSVKHLGYILKESRWCTYIHLHLWIQINQTE